MLLTTHAFSNFNRQTYNKIAIHNVWVQLYDVHEAQFSRTI